MFRINKELKEKNITKIKELMETYLGLIDYIFKYKGKDFNVLRRYSFRLSWCI